MLKLTKHAVSAIALSTFIVLGAGSVDTDQGAKNVANAPTDYVISANDLFAAYDNNSAAFKLNPVDRYW